MMILQNFIKCDNNNLFSLEYFHDNRSKKDPILVISGFSEPMQDHEYFMSKLSRNLYRNNNYVMQLDLYGHGDSSGSVSDISLEIIKNNISKAIEHIQTIEGTDKSIIIISRSLMSTILADIFNNDFRVKYIIGINPYYPDPVKAKLLCTYIRDNIIEYNTLIQGYCKNMYNLEMGIQESINQLSELGLFQGQYVSKEFVIDILLKDYTIALSSKQNTFIVGNNENYEISNWSTDYGYRNSCEVGEISLCEDPLWQYNAIEKIIKIINGNDLKNSR